MLAKSGMMVHEQTANTNPPKADAGYDIHLGASRPRYLVMASLGISAASAPAMKKAGSRHSSTWAAR